MADELDALLERVEDDGLRSELQDHVGRLRRKREFGLVFESHLPERVRLPDHPIRRGSKVVRRDADAKTAPQTVIRVGKDSAVLDAGDSDSEEVPLTDVVVVAEFGEPIYPGLASLGSIDRGGDKPAHVVIKGENYHALEALRFSHAGKIDCIYIDPPYNTGARDWKYDNDYVDADDGYRHSKWLAFMERRLRIAKELLNSEDSVLIVTIDEKEFLRLGLLLGQLFPEGRTQMVTTVIKPEGIPRVGEFSRSNEFIFFVRLGASRVLPELTDDDSSDVPWNLMQRREMVSRRGGPKPGPDQFYPVYIDPSTNRVVEIGDSLPDGVARETAPERDGLEAVFPLKPDGTEMSWSLSAATARDRLARGFIRAMPQRAGRRAIKYLTTGKVESIEAGDIEITGYAPEGYALVRYAIGKESMPSTVWDRPSHNPQTHGTKLLSHLIPGRKFPFPKSLYAVEDTLALFIREKPDAVVLDYFAGSGTTCHAVARLNQRDGGRRTSISITNNEVSTAEADELTRKGLRPGDDDWEGLGIFENITRPRIEAAITGKTHLGTEVKGRYRFVDAGPMGDGLAESVAFLELMYLDLGDVELNRAFTSIAPLLWLRSGAVGEMISSRCAEDGTPLPLAVTDRYGILFDPDHWRALIESLPKTVTTVFIVTDSTSVFASVAGELPEGIQTIRLYENYLATFAINVGQSL